MRTKVFYFDCETTGVDPKTCAIHQIAALIEIDGEIVETLNLKMAPPEGAEIVPEALEIAKVTPEQIAEYPPALVGMSQIIATLNRYVDKYKKTDKFFLAGWNNVGFDNLFLRAAWPDSYFGSYFWANSIDVMVLATQYFLHERADFLNFKLGTVADRLRLLETGKVDLHDALFDVKLTREIYKSVLPENNAPEAFLPHKV